MPVLLTEIQVIGIKDACKLLNIGSHKLYDLVKAGKLRAVNFGTNGKTLLKFKVCDIIAFQDNNYYTPQTFPAELNLKEMANRIFQK